MILSTTGKSPRCMQNLKKRDKQKMGYQSAADLRAGYPKFFWELVSPYISEGIKFLKKNTNRTSVGSKSLCKCV